MKKIILAFLTLISALYAGEMDVHVSLSPEVAKNTKFEYDNTIGSSCKLSKQTNSSFSMHCDSGVGQKTVAYVDVVGPINSYQEAEPRVPFDRLKISYPAVGKGYINYEHWGFPTCQMCDTWRVSDKCYLTSSSSCSHDEDTYFIENVGNNNIVINKYHGPNSSYIPGVI
ncbi:hypothetical protein IB642_03640 [Allofrancisella guangzhouensis]|uniref:Uncharacterized protein n=1 Tax=Allofrancisella guangzhouensis TaxID=594679 RepID=A0A0A8E4Y9_9GAMM|nr:hypothetical protein [Allofrancisella guangzhouensis]AJC49058.1 hypothetical protein SD28_05130 [Allofrancisella guangzhouensis]MBK2027452.1 hypothetical protein [Allofrancisella guangzhouensis]MBK2044111.1 hypothetical protein [Allofrancisella guangzhouensis]MBK2045460.1 hypothetical protein [Allofrancisella guangzhouensis]